MKHLDFAEILEALNSKKRADHLCDSCVERIALLKEFQAAVAYSEILKGKKGSDCLSVEEIADVIDGKDDERASEKQLHIQSCDYCFESAAYYHAESTAMKMEEMTAASMEYIEKATNVIPSAKTVIRTNKTIWDTIRESVRLAPLPAFATAIILFLFIFAERDAIHVSSITDGSQYSVFMNDSDNQPLFYLGKRGKRTGTLPAKMEITIGRQSLKFLWKDVDGANHYSFVLQDISGIAPQTIINIETDKKAVTVESSEFSKDGQYRWIVAGGLPEKRHFIGKLEFRVTK